MIARIRPSAVAVKPNLATPPRATRATVCSPGGGIKGGQIYGQTDEFGWHPVENPVHVNDLHATMLHCFGLEHEKLTYRFQGRDFRVTDAGGKVIADRLA